MAEQTLVLIKPDGLVKSLTGDILSKMSETGLKIVGAKIVQVTRGLAEQHYRMLKNEEFFNNVIKYIMGEFHTKRVMALVYEGPDCIGKIRKVVGATDPEKADPTTIRGKYGRVTREGVFENAVHASSSEEDAEHEIKLWFNPSELVHSIYEYELKRAEMNHYVWKGDDND